MQFLLVLTGVGCIAVSMTNVPRREETRRLERVLDEKRDELHDFHEQSHQAKRRERAMQHDPYYRRIMLKRVTGASFRDAVSDEQVKLLRSS